MAEIGFAVSITYYSNPHLFWFTNKNSSSKKRSELDKKIQCYAETIKRHYHDYAPVIGEVVIVRYCSGCKDKWVRAKVDDIVENQTGTQFKLWIIDYGFPWESTGRWIRKLNSMELRTEEPGDIYKGGIIALPAKTNFNILENKEQMFIKEWSEIAVEKTEALIFDAESVYFCIKTNINGHLFGDIQIRRHNGKYINLSDYLKAKGESMDNSESNFLKEYQSLHQTPYWEYKTKLYTTRANDFKVCDERYTEIVRAKKFINLALKQKMSDWDRRNAIPNDVLASSERLSDVINYDHSNSSASLSECVRSYSVDIKLKKLMEDMDVSSDKWQT